MIRSHSRYKGQIVVCLQWAIGDKVKIPAAEDADGVVYSAIVSKDGVEYLVKWFSDSGTRQAEWFQGDELVRA